MENDINKMDSLITEWLDIQFTVTLPIKASSQRLRAWATLLTDDNDWLPEKESLPQETQAALKDLSYEEQVFFCTYLKLCQHFFELGRLPIFSPPRIKNIIQDTQQPNRLTLSLQVPIVFFIPLKAYKIVIDTTLNLCNWLACNDNTAENKNTAYQGILQNIITPLSAIAPGGKSTIAVLKVAHKLGIPFMHLGLGVYQLGWGCNAKLLDRSISSECSALGAKLSQNKAVTANILKLAGLPGPTHFTTTKVKEAQTAASRLGYPVVVKPLDQERGIGVTINIYNVNSLIEAFNFAFANSATKQVLVEKQASGTCHRLFMLNGDLLYAVKRQAMGVFGNGKDSVLQLVETAVAEQATKAPWLRSEIKALDAIALTTLANAKMTPEDIPEKGRFIPLRPFETTEWGGVDEDVTQQVHPANLAAASQATKLLGLSIAGVDFISNDISQPWYENGAIINEVNFSPLLGGAAISRSYLPHFFKKFIKGNGKIPIKFYNNKNDALTKHAALIADGHRCYYCSSELTLDATQTAIATISTSLKERLRALLSCNNVDMIIIYEGQEP